MAIPWLIQVCHVPQTAARRQFCLHGSILAHVDRAVYKFVCDFYAFPTIARPLHVSASGAEDLCINRGGPLGQEHLKVLIEERRNFIFAPTVGYFAGAENHSSLNWRPLTAAADQPLSGLVLIDL